MFLKFMWQNIWILRLLFLDLGLANEGMLPSPSFTADGQAIY